MAGRRNCTLESLTSFEFVGLYGLEAAYVQSWYSTLWICAHVTSDIRNHSCSPSATTQLSGAAVFFFKVLKKEKLLDLTESLNDKNKIST